MNKKLKKALKWVGIPTLVIGAYFGGLFGLNQIAKRTGETLETLQEAQECLKEEKRKMGCDKPVRVRFSSMRGAGAGKSTQDGTYDILLGTTCRNLNVLQHELYHIHQGDAEGRKLGFCEYFFWGEPRAVWYSLWN